MRDYSKDFAEWRKWRDEKGLPPIYDNPADAGIETDFRVGQQVSFTNEYGVRFEPHIIMGFCKPELSGRCVYLDYDCYWFPTELKSLNPTGNERHSSYLPMHRATVYVQRVVRVA